MPKYTQRHYEDVAGILAETHWTIVRQSELGGTIEPHKLVDIVRDQFIHLFARDNDRFKFDKFVKWSDGKAPR